MGDSGHFSQPSILHLLVELYVKNELSFCNNFGQQEDILTVIKVNVFLARDARYTGTVKLTVFIIFKTVRLS